MKLFLLKVFAFILVLVLYAIPLDYFFSLNLKKSTSFAEGEFSVWNDIYKGNINAGICIYGSSRAWVQINPQIIENETGINTYNLGMDGQSFEIQYLRHLELLKFNKTPKCIIYSLDVSSLESPLGLYNAEQFLPYMLFNKNIEKYTLQYKGFNCFQYKVPLVRYWGHKRAMVEAVKKSVIHTENEPSRVKGFMGMDKEWNNDLNLAKTKFDYYEVVINKEVVQLLKKFIIECKEKNIKLVFVYTPEHKDGQEFVKNRGEVMNLYGAIAKEHGIPFFDYSNDKICLDKVLFYNASHLNKEGANVFTNKLVLDIKQLIKHTTQ